MAEHLYKELTYKIRGALFEIYNILGPGFKESVYHRALVREFTLRKMPFKEEIEYFLQRRGSRYL